MTNETSAILEIMRAVGVLDFVMDRVKDKDELAHLFVNDFEKLMRLCAEVEMTAAVGSLLMGKVN